MQLFERGDERDVVVVMSGPLAGLAGGDTHSLRFVHRWNERRGGGAVLLAPAQVVEHLPPGVADVTIPLRTPLDRWVHHLPVYAAALLLRTFLAVVRMPPTRFVVSTSHFFHDVIPCIAARMFRGASPAVFVYHLVDDMQRSPSLRSRLSTMAERFSLWLVRRWATIVFVDNTEVEHSLKQRGFAPDRVVMTANAFDPLIPMPPRESEGPPVLAYCGRFVEEKGIWDVLELARVLGSRHPEVRIEMIGDGPLRQDFLRRLEASEAKNVTVHGFVSEERKWALLRRAQLFIAPSREEGWGIAVGEALTAGTPVLAYDLPAYGYLGDAIERVPTGDREAFIAAVERYLDQPLVLVKRSEVLSGSGDLLPRWGEVLDAEFAALQTLG